MPTPIIDNVTSLDSVAKNGNFTVRHGVGNFAVDRLSLQLGGDLTKDDISDLYVKADTKPVQYWRLVEHLEAIRAYFRMPVIDDEISFGFLQTWLEKNEDAIRLSFGTANLKQLSVHGKIGATPDAPEMIARSVIRRYPALNLGGRSVDINRSGLVVKVRHMGKPLIGSTTTTITDIPTNEGFLAGIHVFHGGNVTGAQLWANRQNIWNCQAVDGGNDRMAAEVAEGNRVPQDDVHHIDMMLSNVLGDELPLSGVTDFNLKLDHSANDQCDIYAMYLGFIDGIQP